MSIQEIRSLALTRQLARTGSGGKIALSDVAGRVSGALHVVHLDLSTKSAKGANNPKSGLRVVKSHRVPAMQTEPTGDIFQPVRLVRPMRPEFPQQGFQFVGRWQPDLRLVLAGLVHMTMLPPGLPDQHVCQARPRLS